MFTFSFVFFLGGGTEGGMGGEWKQKWKETGLYIPESLWNHLFGWAFCCRTAWLDFKKHIPLGPKRKPFLTWSLDPVVKRKFKDNTNISCWFIFSSTQRHKQGGSNRAIVKYFWGRTKQGSESAVCLYIHNEAHSITRLQQLLTIPSFVSRSFYSFFFFNILCRNFLKTK